MSSKLHDVITAFRALSVSGTGTATVAERTAYKAAADMLDEAVRPRDNGDGTVTLLREVTVPKVWLDDGRDVVAVRAPKAGELYADAVTGALCVDPLPGYHRCPRVVMSDARPKFEAGKWYRDTEGVLRGPLKRYECSREIWEWMSEDGKSYEPDGKGKRGIADLVPGEVTVWQPPVSLAAGVWRWDGRVMICVNGIARFTPDFVREVFGDWTDPPKPGRYRVPGGGKIATWEGE